MQKIRIFEDGVTILRSYFTSVPDSPHAGLAKALEQDFMRKLLKNVPDPHQITGTREANIKIWCSYLELFIKRFDDVVDHLKRDPNIRQKIDKFFLMVNEEPEIVARLVYAHTTMHECSAA